MDIIKLSMIDVYRVKTHEIQLYSFDPELSLREHIPISRLRAMSYSMNPRANSSDVVLYLAYKDDMLVGYRTVMPDSIFVDNKEVKIGWLSGNWVHPAFRRQGIAMLLLDEALKDWNNRLMFTNYALESKAVYDKSGKFEKLASAKGRRFYLRPCLSTLLPPRSSFFKKTRLLLNIADIVLGLINPMLFARGTIFLDNDIEFEYLARPDNEVLEMFERIGIQTLTRRSIVDLQWILRFPWLVSSPLGDRIGKKYYFSSNPKRFNQSIVKVYKGNALLGFVIYNLNDDKLSIPYCSFESDNSGIMANVILLHAIKLKASMITIYQSDLINEIKKRFIFRMFSKSRTQIYFATKGIVDDLKGEPIHFADGDGDCAFL